MAYSKIKSIKVKNFMGYREGSVQFDESGILNFKGYNSSGKSAFLMAIAIALMNLYPQKHLKYIHHDKEYFRIIVEFDDGITIVRDKYRNGQSLYEMYREEKCIFTTKSGNKLTKIEGVPETIANYLGLINTQLGFLNYQVRRDPLWLIDTSGSENYYTLNEVLKSEEIARASALLNSDKNQLQSDLTQIESDLSSARMQLDSYSSLNEDLLLKLSEREIIVQNLLNQYDLIFSIGSVLESLSTIQEIPEIDAIEVDRLKAIQSIQSRQEEVSSISYFTESLEGVDSRQMSDILKLQSVLEEGLAQDRSYFAEDLEGVNLNMWSDLAKVKALVKSYNDALIEYASLKKEKEKLVVSRDKLVAKADAEGKKFVVCGNCGTMMEVAK